MVPKALQSPQGQGCSWGRCRDARGGKGEKEQGCCRRKEGMEQGCSGREEEKGAGMLGEGRGKERGCSGRDAHHHLAAARRQSAAPPGPPSTQRLVLLPLGRFCAWQRQIKTIKRGLSPAAELPGSPLVKGRRAASSGQCQHPSVTRSQGFFLPLEKRIQSVKTSPKSSSLFQESTWTPQPLNPLL